MKLSELLATCPVDIDTIEDQEEYELWFKDSSGKEFEISQTEFHYTSEGYKFIVLKG